MKTDFSDLEDRARKYLKGDIVSSSVLRSALSQRFLYRGTNELHVAEGAET